MRSLHYLILSSAVALIAACTPAAAPPPAAERTPSRDQPAPGAGDEPVKLGVSLPFSGTAAPLGLSALHGIELAVEHINRTGGLLGRQVEIISKDDEGSLDAGASNVKRLIRDDNVFAVLGGVHSAVTAAEIQVTREHNVLHLTPVATAPGLVRPDSPYFWRAVAADNAKARSLLEFARTHQQLHRLFLLYENSDYGKGGADAVATQAGKLGLALAGTETYHVGDRDFRVQIEHYRGSGAEALVLWGAYEEPALIAQQMRSLGLPHPILSGTLPDHRELGDRPGSAVDGLFFPVTFDAASSRPIVDDFVRRFRTGFGSEPDRFAAQGYDAVLLLAAGVRDAGSFDAARVSQALGTLDSVEGVQGKLRFDHARELDVRLPIMVFQDGRVVSAVAG